MRRNVFSCLLKEAGEVAVVTLVERLFHARVTLNCISHADMLLILTVNFVSRYIL